MAFIRLATPRSDEPYVTQTVTLDGVAYDFRFAYDFLTSGWYLDLAAGDTQLMTGRRLVPGRILNRRIRHPQAPAGKLLIVSFADDTAEPQIGDFESGAYHLYYGTADEFTEDQAEAIVAAPALALPTPSEIFGASCKVWLDASDESSMNVFGTSVTRITNKGSLGEYFGHDTSTNQPGLNAGGWLAFDGTNDYLTWKAGGSAQVDTQGLFSFLYSGDWEIWTRYNPDTPGGGSRFLFTTHVPSVTKTGVGIYTNGTTVNAEIKGTTSTLHVNVSQSEVGARTRRLLWRRNTSPLLRLSNFNDADADDSTPTNSVAPAPGGLPVIGYINGDSEYIHGNLSQLVVINRLCSNAERALLKAYLDGKAVT